MAEATTCVDIPKVLFFVCLEGFFFFFKRRKKVLGPSFVPNLKYCFM